MDLRSRGLLAVCLSSLLLGVGACGSDSSSADSAADSAETTSSQAQPSPSEQNTEEAEAEVRAAFDTYISSALAQDGATAVSVLSPSTHDFYDEARRLALSGTAEQVAELPGGQRLTVYSFRAELEPEMVRDASVEELLTEAFERGLVGDQGMEALELGEVEVDGERATAAISAGEQSLPYGFEFVREDDGWKVDLMPTLVVADEALEMTAQEQGMTVDELIDQLLVVQYGEEEAAALHEPLDG